LNRNTGFRGYRPKQASELSVERAQHSRNAPTVEPWVREEACTLLRLQWSPEQIGSKLPISHETLYQHVYTDQTEGVTLWKNLRCQKQKRKRYRGVRDRREQIPKRLPLSERPLHIEVRRQLGHWECDTVIGANRKGAEVKIVERKSRYAVIAKVANKTSELVSSVIANKPKPIAVRVKTMTYDNRKEFARHSLIDQELKRTAAINIQILKIAEKFNIDRVYVLVG